LVPAAGSFADGPARYPPCVPVALAGRARTARQTMTPARRRAREALRCGARARSASPACAGSSKRDAYVADPHFGFDGNGAFADGRGRAADHPRSLGLDVLHAADTRVSDAGFEIDPSRRGPVEVQIDVTRAETYLSRDRRLCALPV